MSRIDHYICIFALIALTVLPVCLQADPISKARLQLIENQRNIIHLRKERQLYQRELQAILDSKQSSTANNRRAKEARLSAKIQELQQDIELADELIANISLLVSQQRLALATMERGSPPSALDIALNKALSANLPELARKLSSNKSAKKEISRLRALLRQQAYLGTPTPRTKTSVSLANEQHIAEEEFLKLLSLFSAGTADESEDKPIKITWTADRTPYVEEETLSYLGHGQYHLETTVYSGKMTFTVDGRPWQLSVSKEEDNANYVIIYDNSSENEPRLVMFNKSLLLE